MGQDTSIQWAKHSWNPWRGRSKVSPGCTNCYAEAWSKRNPKIFGTWGENGTRVVAAESSWRDPIKWDKAARDAGVRHRVFCASMADVFEDWDGPMLDGQGRMLRYNSVATWWTAESNRGPIIMDFVRERLFDLISVTPHLDWLLLTKRPENLENMLPWTSAHAGEYRERYWDNVWIGTTVENQEQADKRIPQLLHVPAKVRFLSMEPQLEKIDLKRFLGFQHEDEIGVRNYDQSLPMEMGLPFHDPWVRGPDWVIQGGESGPKARPFNLAWARKTRDQCKEAGVAYFLKQLGSKACDSFYLTDQRLYLKDSHGGDMSEWPEDLRVREIPEVAHA